MFVWTEPSSEWPRLVYLREQRAEYKGSTVIICRWHRNQPRNVKLRKVLWDCQIWNRSVSQLSSSVESISLWPYGLQHTRFACPSPTPRAFSNSYPSSQWCHPTISSSVVPFSPCLWSFPASGSFPMSQFFVSGGQSIGASASTSIFLMNIQDWFPLGWTGLISLQSKGLSRVFSNTTIQKHQFVGAQLSLRSNSHIIHDYWKNHSFD